MIQHLAFWCGLGFVAGIQPGPLQAFLFQRALTSGWRGTLTAACAPLLSDAPIIAVSMLAMSRLPLQAQAILRLLGGLLLLGLAVQAFRSAGQATATAPASASRTLGAAVLVNLLNPSPWLAWGLVLGPALAQCWRQSPGQAVGLVAAFYGTLVGMLGLMILAMAQASRFPVRTRLRLEQGAAGLLAILGVWQMWTALTR